MILTTHDELAQYQDLCSTFPVAIAWAQKVDWDTLADGKHNIDGDRLFLIKETVTLEPVGSDSVWEAHNRYIDILLILNGTERFGWAPRTDELPVRTPYDQHTDKILFDASKFSGSTLDVRAGQAIIFFPTDSHLPCQEIDGPKPVQRAVFKVRVDE